MGFLKSALIQSLFLFIAFWFIILLTESSIFDHAFNTYFHLDIEGRKISIGSAIGIVNIDETVDNEKIIDFLKYNFFGADSRISIETPQFVIDFLNNCEVGGNIAKFIHYLFIISLIASILCNIFQVGFLFKLKNGRNLLEICQEAVGANPSETYIETVYFSDGKSETFERYPGDTMTHLTFFIMFFIVTPFIIVIWSIIILPVITIDIVLFLCVAIVKFIRFLINKKSDKEPQN